MQEQCTVSIYANICRDLFSRFSLLWENKSFAKLNEARHEKTNILHMRKQRRRSASR